MAKPKAVWRGREYAKQNSNNPVNSNKNLCALAVARAFKVHDYVRYLHSSDDIVRALRKCYTVRSRKSKLPKGCTVGQARRHCLGITNELLNCGFRVWGYCVVVDGHVLALDADGNTHTDTAPRKRDRREVIHFHVIYD